MYYTYNYFAYLHVQCITKWIQWERCADVFVSCKNVWYFIIFLYGCKNCDKNIIFMGLLGLHVYIYM